MANLGEVVRNSESNSQVNVLLIPLPYMSHFISALHFAKQLASYGLSITILGSEANIQRAHEIGPHVGFTEGWEEALGIRFVSLKLPVGRGLSTSNTVLQATRAAFEQYIRRELECNRRPTCLITDVWLAKIQEKGRELNIPAYSFSVFSVSYLCVMMYLRPLIADGIVQIPTHRSSEEAKKFLSIPGLPLTRIFDLPMGVFPTFTSGAREMVMNLFETRAIIANSFQELEPEAFRGLNELLNAELAQNGRKVPAIWAVGPTFNLGNPSNGLKGSTGGVETRPCMEWLDSQQPASVLYVAFGNDVNLSRDQMYELALGLEASEQPFLCVLHPAMVGVGEDTEDVSSVLPAGFISRNKQKGMVVQGWLPQLKVLAHPSTGGFLTHCGYNSMLESLCNGVPMLTWPVQAEQFLNARFLLDGAKIALGFCKGEDGLVGRKEVERSVRTLFSSEEGLAMRQRAAELKGAARAAVGENGRSMKNMEALVEDIKSLVAQPV